MGKTMDYTRVEKNAKIKRKSTKAVTYFLLSVWAVMVLFPDRKSVV